MPVKHQGDSYRTRRGVRYTCWTDLLDESIGPLNGQAKELVRDLKASGRHAFYETHDDGYIRVFTGPDGSLPSVERARAARKWLDSALGIYVVSGPDRGQWTVEVNRERSRPFDTWTEAVFWAHERVTGIPHSKPGVD